MLKYIAAVLLLLMVPFGAASKDEVPYLNITSPLDGSTISGTAIIKFNAEGKGLKNPFLVIEGDSSGQNIPLNCTVSEPINGGLQQMYCSYEWNTKPLDDQKVTIQAGVNSYAGTLSDSIRVLVSGESA